jgi:hypothetical protein
MGIESKLIVGRFINMNRPNIPAPADAQGTFVTRPITHMTIEESTGLLQKISNLIIGQNDRKVYRNFQWLAWFPGAISNVPLSSGDVLTGPMSGCWLVIYRQNGVESVGHIGTADSPPSPQSKAAKEARHRFANTVARTSDLIAGFNPARAWTGFPARQPGDGQPDILGLVSTSRELYTVLTYKGDGLKRGFDLRRIADVRKVTGEGSGKLLHLFGDPPILSLIPMWSSPQHAECIKHFRCRDQESPSEIEMSLSHYKSVQETGRRPLQRSQTLMAALPKPRHRQGWRHVGSIRPTTDHQSRPPFER